jgi:ribosomal protection tetracycline resistance protein
VSCTPLNLGILAHVDAGKTTLTERLLYAAGVIDELGSVDHGNTQTDTLALERQRGITIKSAVVSFVVDGVTVNLIDTPGHPDFIAEVERVLSVLDGAVLVISAVEGVQPQTRILMRALQRLRVPTLLFVNKIDRRGADVERVVRSIAERLTPAIVPMGRAHHLGTREAAYTPCDATDDGHAAMLASALAENDDAILAAYVDDDAGVPLRRLRDALAAQTARALVHPVYAGSALTGAGVDALTKGVVELLPAEAGDPDGPVSGTAFKVERGRSGEKVAYVRLFSGAVRTRDRLRLGDDVEAKITAIRVFEGGRAVQRSELRAGEIGKLWGLGEIRIGDAIGIPRAGVGRHHFAPPTLETVVVPEAAGDKAAVRVALAQLAEQDPLIDVRQDDTTQELSVSLYGEVQKEVIQATLVAEYGLDVTFREATPICVERPSGIGDASEVLHAETNPFLATIGLRVEPARAGAGVAFRLDVDARTVPLYVYKTLESFTESMDGYVRRTLREGLFGWQVTDSIVTMTRCAYSIPDGPPSRRGPPSTAADFRRLTPLVLMQALEAAGTVVCEPVVRAGVEVPTDSLGSVLPALARLGAAVVGTPSAKGALSTIDAMLPAARVQELQRQLPRLTRGEGVLETQFAGYEPVAGAPPVRPRTTVSPLDRAEYLMALAHRVERHT